MRPVLWLACVLLFSCLSTFAQSGETVKVAAVLGTDLIQLEDGTKVGLLGITTPQSRAITKQDCIDHLSLLIKGKTVRLVADTLVPDKEGKTPQRYVYLDDKLINLRMISDGYAAPSKTSHSFKEDFATAYANAKSSQRGAHATEKSTAEQCPATTQQGTQCQRYTTNLSGKCWQLE